LLAKRQQNIAYFCSDKWHTLCDICFHSGLTGFDSKTNGYVSMPSLAMTLVNLDREQQLAKIITLSQLNRSTVDSSLILPQGDKTRHPAGGDA